MINTSCYVLCFRVSRKEFLYSPRRTIKSISEYSTIINEYDTIEDDGIDDDDDLGNVGFLDSIEGSVED